MKNSLIQLQAAEHNLSASSALSYYLKFVDENNAVIQKTLFEKLRKVDSLKDIMANMTLEQMMIMSENSQQVIWGAYHSHKWDDYRNYLFGQGETYATLGLEFSDWIRIITLHRDCLLSLCKQKLAKAVVNIAEVWEGSTLLGDYALEVISGAYLNKLEETIRQKQADEAKSKFALREATRVSKQISERFRLAADSSSAGIWDWDLSTDEVYYSDRFKELLGYEPDEWPHTFEAFRKALHEEDRNRTLDKISASLNHSEPYDITYRLRLKSGKYRWFMARGKVLRDNLGQAYRMAGSIADIHQRVQAEKQLENLNKSLEGKVAQRTAKLQAINEELESFSYTVSHDLRAPLRAINGYSSFLIKRDTGNLNEEQIRFLNTIQENVEKMGDLIDDLLLYSRMGRAKINRVNVNMNQLVNEVFSELKVEGQNFDYEIGSLPDAIVDRALIKRVWANLISNAIKYSAHLDEPLIKVGCNESSKRNQYWVRDNGAGFNMKYASKLFGMFQRLHTDDEFEGTGVGLAIVKRLVLKHGGEVSAKGEIDKGATFYFTILKNQQ